MTELEQLTARRAIESLRSGVPSGAAVLALGWTNPAHEQRFRDLLARVAAGAGGQRGLLVKGDFGTGKSHLLGYLEHLALQDNFVVSRVTISKETPLFKSEKVFAAAVRDGKVPDSRGAVLHELAPRVDFQNTTADSLSFWAMQAPGMLAASIHLLERNVELGDDELIARIIDWWSGEKLSPAEVRSGLRRVGSQQAFDVRAIRAVDMAPLRIALTSHVIRAAGFAGWVILFDELELIGRYSNLQRANSYAQLARWFGLGGEDGTSSMVCVGTITDDFVQVVLEGGGAGRDDRARLPEWLSHRGRPGDDELASLASRGMDLIDEPGALHLVGPDEATLQHAYAQVLDVYRTAFNWSPAPGIPKFVSTTTPMRTYIKTWIYEWDLIRLGVTEQPSVESEMLLQSYDEDSALQQVRDDSEGE